MLRRCLPFMQLYISGDRSRVGSISDLKLCVINGCYHGRYVVQGIKPHSLNGAPPSCLAFGHHEALHMGKRSNTCRLLPCWHHAQRLVAVLYCLRPRLRRHHIRGVLRGSLEAGRLRRRCHRGRRVITGAEVRRHL